MSVFGFSLNGSDQQAADPADSAVPEQNSLTEKEKALRDLFVAEYLVDYDRLAAAMRCGFEFQLAMEWSARLFQEPYVQQRIARLRISADVDQDSLEEYNKRRVREGLISEAFYRGPGSSHSARVSALKALATINGMVPKGDLGKGGPSEKGGVMAVPGIADIDDWEKTASASQDALVQHAGTGE